MSNTSNNWKSQGGINRRSTNNILSNSKQSISNLTIPQHFGISNTTIQQRGDTRNIDVDAGSLYKMTKDSQIYDNMIAYYPFNNIAYDSSTKNILDNTIISNQSLNSDVNQSNFNLNLRSNPSSINAQQYNPIIASVPTYAQNAIQFRNSSKCLMTNTYLNTINAFGQAANTQSISTNLTIETFIYIPNSTTNFCIFALDDINQSGLNHIGTGNSNNGNCFYLWYNKGSSNNNTLNKAQIYYRNQPSFTNSYITIDISSNDCGNITPNTWHKISMVFGGSYIALYIDSTQTFYQQITGGSYIPDKPFAINLAKISAIDVNVNADGPMLLDTTISLKANTKEFIEYLASPGDGHQYSTSKLPNSGSNELIYLLSDEYIIFNAPVSCETDVNIAGVLNNYGTNNLYAQSNFFDTAHFYGDVGIGTQPRDRYTFTISGDTYMTGKYRLIGDISHNGNIDQSGNNTQTGNYRLIGDISQW